MYDIYKYGPIVQIACDVPNQELNVTMTVDTDGKSELYFIPHGEAGPINVWLYVVDFYAPFSWRILENTESITLYSLNEHSYAAYPSSAVSGEGQAVAFRMHFQEGEYAISRIALQPMNGRQFLRERRQAGFDSLTFVPGFPVIQRIFIPHTTMADISMIQNLSAKPLMVQLYICLHCPSWPAPLITLM